MRKKTGSGSRLHFLMRRRQSSSTGGIFITDEKIEGYVVDGRGKVVGGARSFDPYSSYGEIMLYDIDSFGFVLGFLHSNWRVMSEEDLMQDKKLRKSLATTQYETWKRHNMDTLKTRWSSYGGIFFGDFDLFCRSRYRDAYKKLTK